MLLLPAGEFFTGFGGGYDVFVNPNARVVKACPDDSFVVSITGAAGNRAKYVTSLGPITCSDGSSLDLAPQISRSQSSGSAAVKQNATQGTAGAAVPGSNGTASVRQEDQPTTTSTISSPSGFVAVNIRTGFWIDLFQPVPARGHASDGFGSFTGGLGPGPQLQCPGGMVVGGLAVNWGGYTDFGPPESFDLPIQVGLMCRKVSGSAYKV